MGDVPQVLVQQRNGNGFDARRLSLPAVSAVVFAFFAVWATFWLNNEVRVRDERIGALESQIDNFRIEMDQKTTVRWTVIDMAMWCLQFRLQNAQVKCPDPTSVKQNLPQETQSSTKQRRVRQHQQTQTPFWPW